MEKLQIDYSDGKWVVSRAVKISNSFTLLQQVSPQYKAKGNAIRWVLKNKKHATFKRYYKDGIKAILALYKLKAKYNATIIESPNSAFGNGIYQFLITSYVSKKKRAKQKTNS